jgi:RecB family exonuclease
VQLGRALEDGLARRAGGWAGLTAHIPRHYAATLARSRVAASGRTELPVAGLEFLMADVLRGLDDEALPSDAPRAQHLASTVADTLQTLRLNGVSRAVVRKRAADPASPSTFSVVAACYDSYHEVLAEKKLYDDAQVFRWAAEAVVDDPALVEDTVVAVCDGVDLPARSFAFVQALRDACDTFYRLGGASPEDAPPQTAAARFGDRRPPVSPNTDAGPDSGWRFRRAVGHRAEVRAALRDLLAADVPFDDVELAFTESAPYLSLLADQAEQIGVPVTIGPGRPASMTRTGQALRAFFDWITDGFEAEGLVRMLRSGLLRLDRLQASEEGEPMAAHEVATILAAHRYEPGRTGYSRTLAAVEQQLEADRKKMQEASRARERVQEKRDRVRRVRRIVEALVSLVPRRASIQAMATAARQVVERMGPVDPPPEALPEAERSLDQAARTVLWQKLDALTELPFDYEATDARLASLLRRWLDGQYVRAQSPQPGAVHVLPLESAGYGDRSHLYVLGMDGDTFSTAAPTPGGLRDADRRALGDGTDGMVAAEDVRPADEALWRATQALARHTGTTSLYARTFDVKSGEERAPAPLFLQLEAAHGTPESDAPPAGLVPEPTDVMLQASDAWLAGTRRRGEASEATAREALAREHPWIGDGEAARAARTGDTYGTHDGLLAAGEYPELGLEGGRPVSASRLETLAETPYVYFLRYVLGVEPLNEPALEDEPWLTPLRRGSILHVTFERFMRTLDARPTPDDAGRLDAILHDVLEEEARRVAPRSEVEREAAHRRLRRDAEVFLRAEVEHTQSFEPLKFEFGFGMGPRRRQPGDEALVHLSLGDLRLPLRGRIDRIDRGPDGVLALWDYKTGRSDRYDEDDPLQDGAHLQWALYAYALDELWDEPVEQSGYFFPTAEEMGTRIAFHPAQYRTDVERLVERLNALACSGSFPMTPEAKTASAWRYRGYDRLVHDLDARSRTLKQKGYPEDRPLPPGQE